MLSKRQPQYSTRSSHLKIEIEACKYASWTIIADQHPTVITYIISYLALIGVRDWAL